MAAVICATISLSAKDSLKVYELGGVEVEEKIGRSKIDNVDKIDVPYYVIQNSDVASASNLQIYLPAAYVRTNSRGESMLFLRGAGERQLGLFFDGAAMNIPWDNRLDLTSVPADIIGEIRVNNSANSMFFGPNVLGGAVSVSTIERATPGYGFSGKIQAGDGGKLNYSALGDGRIGNFNFVANLSQMQSAGEVLSGNAPSDLGNQNPESALRTNTDSRRINSYLRGEYSFDGTTVGLSFSYMNQAKGVAPETFAGDNARFWKYPDRNRFITTLNARRKFSEKLSLKGTFWYDKFDQQINDYSSLDYDEINEIQNDWDDTFGSRISLGWNPTENRSVSFVFNGFTGKHEQAIDDGEKLLFSQNTASLGAEYAEMFGDLKIDAGTGIDYNSTPKTGVFTEAEGESASDFAGFISAKYYLSDNLAGYASLARRTRFPTMREMYDGAMGKFKVNPDLKPETGLLGEVGAILAFDDLELEAAFFRNSYDDLIERIRLGEDVDPRQRRMRVNYASATISGLDANVGYYPIRGMKLSGYATYMFIDAEQDGEEIEHLVQKPEFLAGMVASYRSTFGLKPQVEFNFVGTQYDSDPEVDGEFVEIDPSAVINLRLAYERSIGDEILAEVFVRVNNATDEYRLSQWGLPEPGRTVYGGVSVRM